MITPLEQASALDPRYYTDPNIYERDLTEIHATGWQVIAGAESLQSLGDSMTAQVAGAPVIVVKTAEGIRGFLNICAHRGGPLRPVQQQALQLRCGYHGWTYDLSGRLNNAPKMTQAEGFQTADIHLTSIEIEEWQGLVFARLQTGVPFKGLMQGVLDILPKSVRSGLTHHAQRRYQVNANWKIYVDNFLEGYHLPFVHPALTQVVEFPAYTTQLGKHWSLQRAPIPEDAGPYGEGEGLYFFIYPNTMLNYMPGRLQTNRVVPTGIDSCEVEFDFYYTDTEKSRASTDIKFTDEVQEEDRLICEHVQKSYRSGKYKPGRLSPEKEQGVWHWHNLLLSAYGSVEG